MRLKSGLLLSVVAGTIGLVTLPTAAARADTSTVLSYLGAFHQVVADTADGYLFFSEGLSSDSLLTDQASGPLFVSSLSGVLVATIDQGDGVEGMALSPDGKTLYVALSGTDEVAGIDIASIKTDPTAPAQTLYPLTTGDVPYSVAVQSGEVYARHRRTVDVVFRTRPRR
jgi:DNA-binding beta-propeller fold protein YncE